MNEEDVRRVIAEHLTDKPRGLSQDTVQWLVRSAYEEGWRAGGGDPAVSHHAAAPVGWRAAWMCSESRNTLVRNGMISGKDAYK